MVGKLRPEEEEAQALGYTRKWGRIIRVQVDVKERGVPSVND